MSAAKNEPPKSFDPAGCAEPAGTGHLAKIEAYLAKRFSPRNASLYVARIVSACTAIGKAPFPGTKREDIGPSVRTVGVERRVSILFVVEPDRIVILGIGYAGRSPRSS